MNLDGKIGWGWSELILPKKQQMTYGEDRRCVECKSKLSMYNPSDKCFRHGVNKKQILKEMIDDKSLKECLKIKEIML